MADKIITLEDRPGPYQAVFQRLMRMVPNRDKHDKHLQRLILFRLRVDGEAATSEYLIRKIREVIQCAYTGSLYDYLKNDLKQRECRTPGSGPEPPDVA